MSHSNLRHGPSLYSDTPRFCCLLAACPLASFLYLASGLLAPMLSEVLYEKGPIWPLAAFGPSMVLAAVFSGQLFLNHKKFSTRHEPSLFQQSLFHLRGLDQIHPLSFRERPCACVYSRLFRLALPQRRSASRRKTVTYALLEGEAYSAIIGIMSTFMVGAVGLKVTFRTFWGTLMQTFWG